MPFVFRLAAVLRQRELAETLAQKTLAERRRDAAAVEDELRALQGGNHAAGAFMADGRLSGPINLQLLAAHRRYLNSVATVGRAKIRRLAVAREAVEAARRDLAEAARRAAALRALRDKAEAAYRLDLKRKQDKADDEAAVQRAHAARD